MAQNLKNKANNNNNKEKPLEFWSENTLSDKFISSTSICSVPATNSLCKLLQNNILVALKSKSHNMIYFSDKKLFLPLGSSHVTDIETCERQTLVYLS